MDRETEFRRVYEGHRTAVHAYFVGRTVDRSAAADLTQEVFLRVWQRLPELTGMPDDRQRAWIFTVARNLSIDTYRHERTRTDTEAALRHQPTPTALAASTAVIEAQRVAVVSAAMARLPEEQRITLTMAAAGDMTSAEIAAALGIPAGTVRYRLSVARRTLAAALADYDDPPTGAERVEER